MLFSTIIRIEEAELDAKPSTSNTKPISALFLLYVNEFKFCFSAKGLRALICCLLDMGFLSRMMFAWSWCQEMYPLSSCRV